MGLCVSELQHNEITTCARKQCEDPGRSPLAEWGLPELLRLLDCVLRASTLSGRGLALSSRYVTYVLDLVEASSAKAGGHTDDVPRRVRDLCGRGT